MASEPDPLLEHLEESFPELSKITVASLSPKTRDETFLNSLEGLRKKYPGKHLILIREDLKINRIFLFDLKVFMTETVHRLGKWGIVANGGILFPGFQHITNSASHIHPGNPFHGTMLASAIQDNLVIINSKLTLDNMPAEKGNFFAALASQSWRHGFACYITHIRTMHAESTPHKNERILVDYFSTYYNNPRIVLPDALLELKIAPAASREISRQDYYKDTIRGCISTFPYLPKFSTVILASSEGINELDQTLLSLAAQYRKPDLVIVVFLDSPNASSRKTVIEYEDYYPIRMVSGYALMTEIKRQIKDGCVTFAYASTLFYPNFFSDIFATFGNTLGLSPVTSTGHLHLVTKSQEGSYGKSVVAQTSWRNIPENIQSNSLPFATTACAGVNFRLAQEPELIEAFLAGKTGIFFEIIYAKSWILKMDKHVGQISSLSDTLFLSGKKTSALGTISFLTPKTTPPPLSPEKLSTRMRIKSSVKLHLEKHPIFFKMVKKAYSMLK